MIFLHFKLFVKTKIQTESVQGCVRLESSELPFSTPYILPHYKIFRGCSTHGVVISCDHSIIFSGIFKLLLKEILLY